jgi:predicted transposase YbfD/YdcC
LKAIAQLKETKNVEVVLQVKGNQKKLLEKCLDIAETKTPYAKSTHKGKRERNRIETRTVSVFAKDAHNLGDVWNDHIKVVIKVERKTQTFNTITKQFDQSEETAVYVSTTNRYSAKELGCIIRSHWGIENAQHYVRDVSLREDFSRIRKNPEHIALLRSFALNLLRINHEGNISQALYRNALNVTRVLDYVGVKG